MPDAFKQVIPQTQDQKPGYYRLNHNRDYAKHLAQTEDYADQIDQMTQRMAQNAPDANPEELRQQAIADLQRQFLGKYVSKKYTAEDMNDQTLRDRISMDYLVIDQNRQEVLQKRIKQNKNLAKEDNDAFWWLIKNGATNRKEDKRKKKIRNAAEKYQEANRKAGRTYADVTKQALHTLEALDLRHEGMRLAAEAKSYNEEDEQYRKNQADLKIAGAQSAYIRYTFDLLKKNGQWNSKDKKIRKRIQQLKDKQAKCDKIFAEALKKQKELRQGTYVKIGGYGVPLVSKSKELLSPNYTAECVKFEKYFADRFMKTRKIVRTPENLAVLEKVNMHFAPTVRDRGENFMFFLGEEKFDKRMMEALRESVEEENQGKPAERVFELYDELLPDILDVQIVPGVTDKKENLFQDPEALRKWYFFARNTVFLRASGDLAKKDETYDYIKHLQRKYGEKTSALIIEKFRYLAAGQLALHQYMNAHMGVVLANATHQMRLDDKALEKEQLHPSGISMRLYTRDLPEYQLTLEMILTPEMQERCKTINRSILTKVSSRKSK